MGAPTPTSGKGSATPSEKKIEFHNATFRTISADYSFFAKIVPKWLQFDNQIQKFCVQKSLIDMFFGQGRVKDLLHPLRPRATVKERAGRAKVRFHKFVVISTLLTMILDSFSIRCAPKSFFGSTMILISIYFVRQRKRKRRNYYRQRDESLPSP